MQERDAWSMDGEGCNWQKGKEQRELVNENKKQKA